MLDVYPEGAAARVVNRSWSTPNLIMSSHCAVDDADRYAEGAIDLFSTICTAMYLGSDLVQRRRPAHRLLIAPLRSEFIYVLAREI